MSMQYLYILRSQVNTSKSYTDTTQRPNSACCGANATNTEKDLPIAMHMTPYIVAPIVFFHTKETACRPRLQNTPPAAK